MRSFGRRRTGVVVAAGGLAGLLACASVAMACIPYKGKMEVEGIGDGATSVEVVGNGRGMNYCTGEPYGPSASLPNPGGAGTFKVKVKPTTQGDCVSQLLGHHKVRFWPYPSSPATSLSPPLDPSPDGPTAPGADSELGTTPEEYKCFPWNADSGPVGDLIVGPDGTGEGVYQIPPRVGPGYGAVCLINGELNFLGGHRAPILLL